MHWLDKYLLYTVTDQNTALMEADLWVRVRFMMLNTTFNNISVISWRSFLLVEETGVPGEKYPLATSHYITYYYMTSDNVFSDWLTSLVTFFDKTLYSTCKKSRELNITFQRFSRHLKIEMMSPNYLKSSSQSSSC